MTWRPIAQAGVAFTFSQTRGTPQLEGSTVVATSEDGPSWSISFDDGKPRNIRITVQDYSSQRQQLSEDPSYFEFTVGEDSVLVVNEILEDANEFVPNPVTGAAELFAYEAGAGSEQHRIESFSMLVEVDSGQACQELGRVSRAFVSGYTRSRVHDTRVFPSERRCLVANLNGAIPKSESIARAVWRLDPVFAVAMSDPTIEGREARVMIRACYRGEAAIKCEVTLSNGETYVQLFRVWVLPGPHFGDENTAAGPAMLQVDA